jgi:hypothetical protein
MTFELLHLITQLPEKGFFATLKFVFILISIILAIGIIWLFFITSWFQERFGLDIRDLLAIKTYKKNRLERKWQRIKQRLESPWLEDDKIAIIEGEDFLQEFLARKGIKGKILADKIENIPAGFLSSESLNQLKEANALATKVIKNPDYSLKPKEAKRFLEILEKIINELS